MRRIAREGELRWGSSGASIRVWGLKSEDLNGSEAGSPLRGNANGTGRIDDEIVIPMAFTNFAPHCDFGRRETLRAFGADSARGAASLLPSSLDNHSRGTHDTLVSG